MDLCNVRAFNYVYFLTFFHVHVHEIIGEREYIFPNIRSYEHSHWIFYSNFLKYFWGKLCIPPFFSKRLSPPSEVSKLKCGLWGCG